MRRLRLSEKRKGEPDQCRSENGEPLQRLVEIPVAAHSLKIPLWFARRDRRVGLDGGIAE